jgi:hypothetical protein
MRDFGQGIWITIQRALERVPLVRRRKVTRILKGRSQLTVSGNSKGASDDGQQGGRNRYHIGGSPQKFAKARD